MFQRLSTYSTPHNDVWSLGVILVNLTCGRNPWKQACPSDETFCAYLGNPDFLRSILPISDHTNRILKRIFALNPQARISLAELRREILAVKRFTMTEEELQHATRATREAAKAFAQSGKEHASPERPAAVAAEHGHESNVVYVTDSEEEGDGDDAMQDVEVVAKPAPTWTYAGTLLASAADLADLQKLTSLAFLTPQTSLSSRRQPSPTGRRRSPRLRRPVARLARHTLRRTQSAARARRRGDEESRNRSRRRPRHGRPSSRPSRRRRNLRESKSSPKQQCRSRRRR